MRTRFDLSRNGLIIFVAVAGWLAAIGYGGSQLFTHSLTPGLQADPSASWPAGADIQPATDRATLLAFLHPYCPCSTATLVELERLMVCCRDRVEVWAFLWTPASSGPEWVRASPLWEQAERISGIRVRGDTDGATARQFRSRTSGQVLLYTKGRVLSFKGGITPSRGHSGDSTGGDAIRSILSGQEPFTRSAPVFGCALYAD